MLAHTVIYRAVTKTMSDATDWLTGNSAWLRKTRSPGNKPASTLKRTSARPSVLGLAMIVALLTVSGPATAYNFCAGQVASDLGIAHPTLNKWIASPNNVEVVSQYGKDLARENERLRREIRILTEERELLRKAIRFFANQEP